MGEHLSTAGELQRDVEMRVVLERVDEIDEKWKFNGLQNLLLRQRVFDLFQFDDRLFLHDLQRERLTAALGNHHSAERARAHRSLQLEIFESTGLLGRLGVFRLELVLGMLEIGAHLRIDLSLT